MKKLWYVAGAVFLAAGLLLSCGGGGGDEDGNGGAEPPGTGTLTIRNQSSAELELVHWMDDFGYTYFFGIDLIWDPYIEDYVYGLFPGSSYLHQVYPGSSYIYFWISVSPDFYRTDALVSVNAGDAVVFTFTDETIVWTLDEGEGIVFDLDDAVRVPSDVNDRRSAAREAELLFGK